MLCETVFFDEERFLFLGRCRAGRRRSPVVKVGTRLAFWRRRAFLRGRLERGGDDLRAEGIFGFRYGRDVAP